MAKTSKKATRKFEKNHLSGTLERRKAGAKVKQKLQLKAKRKSRQGPSGEQDANKGHAGTGPNAAPVNGRKEDKLGKMSVDEFFQGGIELPKKPATMKTKAKLGKRKRDAARALTSDSDSDADAQIQSASEDTDDGEEETGMSKEAMQGLAEKDPEFYNYLKHNDPEALDFDEDADLAEVDELSSEDEGPKKKKRKAKDDAEDEDDTSDVSQAMVQKWKKAMTEQHSMRAMRQVVLAFRAAAHVNEDEGKEYKYTISSPESYHDLLLLALQHVPTVLNHHLPVKDSGTKVRIATDSKKFKTLTPLIKSHVASLQHLLKSLSDASTLKHTLNSLLPLLPYLLPFRKILKSLLGTVVDIWSDASSSEATKITAFLVLRRVMVIADAGVRETVLKLTYQGLVKGSRTTTMHTLPGINLMKNSAAELFGIDQTTAYTTSFVFIRQLAIHLRTSLKNNANESFKAVYNWQYIHSLDFWSCVLSEHCSPLKEAEAGKEAQLRPLIYPLVQISLGAMRLIPTSTYFPLRFHLTRSLLRVSRATGTYIPLSAALLEVLNSAEMKKAPKASTLKPLDFAVNYKASKSYLRTRVYQDGVGEQVVELFSEFFALWCKSVAFPELSLPVVVMLKRWLKESGGQGRKHAGHGGSGNKNTKVNTALQLLVQKLDANARWITERRAKVEFAPNNRAEVEAFLKDAEWQTTPLGAFVAGQRRTREERAKTVEEARRREEKERDKAVRGGDGGGDDGVVSEEASSDDEEDTSS